MKTVRSHAKTFALSGLASLFLGVTAAAQRAPNVILVITDDQGYGDVGAHGNTMIHTPNMDTLHKQSVRLTDFHVDPTCSPTRAALMSGRYSTRTGVWHTIMGRSLMRTEEVTIAEVLKKAGYRTGMFGKWHLGENYPLRPQDQGFDDVCCHGGGGVGQGPDYWGNDYFDDTYFRNGKPEKFTGYCTDIWFAEAQRFVRENKDKPFFCYLSTNAPHGPLFVDPKWSDPYVKKGVAPNQAKFYGMIENIDWNLGRLQKQLDQLGLTENTIMIFMTDNGTAAGRVDQKRKRAGKWAGFNAGMRGNKGSEFDGGHRVPFFIRWPKGGITGGRDVDYLCAHVDVQPTIAALCSTSRGKGPAPDGISLAALLQGMDEEFPKRTMFVHSQRIHHPKKWRKSAVMTERWRLVNGKQLFDMKADPSQKKNVAEAFPNVLATLTEEYEAWWKSLSVGFDKSVHIALGSDHESPTQLHPHDWQPIGKKGGTPWHQNHIKRENLANGEWFVDVKRAAKYRIELRRWPDHTARSINAKAAQITIAGKTWSKTVNPRTTVATFVVDLPKGETTLRTQLTLPNDKTRGAFFVYVTELD